MARKWPVGEAHIPDIVLYHDTPATDSVPDATAPQRMAGLEAGYCDEISTTEKREHKARAYEPATRRLKANGHTLSLQTQALGARVPVVRKEWATWAHLGIPRDRWQVLHNRIWRFSVT